MVVNGGEKGNLRKIIGKNYLWVGPNQESQSFVSDMVVEKKTLGKSVEKLLLGWLNLRIPRFSFGYDGEW
jgi:hypothetical protein